MLSGKQLWSLRIIENGYSEKIDDGHVPSYGLDGMLYTFRSEEQPWTYYYLESLQFILLKTVETVNMPLDCGGLLTLKSTYGRKGGILTTSSPVDPGYVGKLSIGIFNGGHDTLKLDSRGGFMQMSVFQMSEEGEAYQGRWQHGK